MDRLIYTAMTGVKHILAQQATSAHNLANVSTTGFRAQIDSFRAVPVNGDGLPTRAFVVDATVGADFATGPLQQTGRELDVALNGAGWLAVQLKDGTEAYTRNGSLKVSENGLLQTQSGLNVQGDGGPIGIPPGASVSIAADGTVSGTAPGADAAAILGRLKLVDPPTASMVRGDDGLFRLAGGEPAAADAAVRVVSGQLEGSNVNVVEAMVTMIGLGRQFELQQSLVKKADDNAAKAAQLLAMG